MAKTSSLLIGLSLYLAGATSGAAQKLNNDGFQRHNGQMHILRNGQLRPMLRNVTLPTGAVVTKDGFVVGADGQRRELREGQGCDLRGNPVTVVSSEGGLALRTPSTLERRAVSAAPARAQVRAVLEDLFGGGRGEHDREEREEDDKYEEKAREQRKKEEEWAREERKRQEEYDRERGKKWKGKRKEGKKWDD